MSRTEFDKDSAVFGLVLGIIIGICLSGIANTLCVSRQTECKEFDGIQVCREVVYHDWKVKEVDK